MAPAYPGDPTALQAGVLAFRPVLNEDGAIIDMVCTQVNEQAVSMLHMNVADILQSSILDIHPKDLEATLFRSYAKVVETGEPLKIETEYMHNGQPLTWSVKARREAEDLVLSISDISEQQRQAPLREERDRLQAAGGFVRLLGHEVRNPLNNILLALGELEAEEDMTPERQRFLDMVHRNADRIDQLIRELLHTSREREMKLVPGPLKEALSAAMAHVLDRCQLRGARYTLEVDPVLEDVLMDSASLTMAFTNLFVNAMEAMEPGKGQLEVRAALTNGRVQVTVSDNGKGMSEEDLQRIYQPFFTGRKGGLGFGLTEARNIFNAHGILLSIHSELGTGTLFTLLFPPNAQARAAMAPPRMRSWPTMQLMGKGARVHPPQQTSPVYEPVRSGQ
jgi:signal transduction histidine kinase